MQTMTVPPSTTGLAGSPTAKRVTPAPTTAKSTAEVSGFQQQVERWKEIAAPAESTFTILAILGATLWFFLRRQRFPHANVRQDIKYWHTADRIILHVVLIVTNVGEVVLRLKGMKMRIQQLLPTPEAVRSDLLAGRDPVREGETEILWPDIAARECKWKWLQMREIEPGETDEFHFDFVLPADIKAVEVYTHIRNRRKRFRRIGWNATSLCAFSDDVVFAREGVPIAVAPSEAGEEMSAKDRGATKEVQKQGPAKTTSTEKRQGPEKTSTSTSNSGSQGNKK